MKKPVFRHLPDNKDLKQQWNEAAQELFQKIVDLNITDLQISEYSKNYLSDYHKRLHYGIETALFILAQALKLKPGKKPGQLIVVDHGGGTGLISMVAKKCGFQKVFYHDIFESSARDAQEIAIQLNCAANQYFGGELNLLAAHAGMTKEVPDLMVSRNVFEHIFDCQEFLQECALLGEKKMGLFFATTSNPCNPATRLYIKKLHTRAEFKGFASRWGKSSDNTRAFFEVRSDLIAEAFPNLSKEQIQQFAAGSRGMSKPQILSYISAVQRGENYAMPNKNIGSNTCNPYTGNWAERLTPLSEIESWFNRAGYQLEVINGFYDTHYPSKVANSIARILNSATNRNGFPGKIIAPFIGLAGISRW